MGIDLPALIGHRGAAAVAPENTLAGLSAAHQAGVAWVEVDVKLSADNVAILMHDDDLRRTTDGHGPVRQKTFAEIAALDAGSWFDDRFKAEAVPTLQAGLQHLQALDLGLNLEIKPCRGRGPQTAAVAAAVLAAHNFPLEQVLITSFDWTAIAWLAEHAPRWHRGLLAENLNCDWQASSQALGCVSLHVADSAVDREAIGKIHDAGMCAAAYTINSVHRAAALRAAGLDAVITDDPGKLLPALPADGA